MEKEDIDEYLDEYFDSGMRLLQENGYVEARGDSYRPTKSFLDSYMSTLLKSGKRDGIFSDSAIMEALASSGQSKEDAEKMFNVMRALVEDTIREPRR